MSDKLNIRNEMRQFDTKNRQFFDELTAEEKKKFSNYLMLRWGSSVKGNGDLAKYYVLSMNQHVNKNFWDLNKHPKLQWLLLTCVSPDMGVFDHEWLAYRAKASKSKTANLLLKIYPTMKIADAEVLDKQMTKQDYKDLLIEHGWEDKKIKEALDK